MPEAARAMGLQIQVLNASTRNEIEAAFATLVRDRADALYIAGDVFFTSRRVQFTTLAASFRIPASYASREAVEAGGLMGYDTDRAGMYRQVGTYTRPSHVRFQGAGRSFLLRRCGLRRSWCAQQETGPKDAG